MLFDGALNMKYDINIKNIVTAELILDIDGYSGLDHKSSEKERNRVMRSELDYVKVLKDFNYTIPEQVLQKHLNNRIRRGALVTYSFVKAGKGEKIDPRYLRWTPITHRHFNDNVKERVLTSLLCFRRIKFIPKDLRNLLLEQAFFEK